MNMRTARNFLLAAVAIVLASCASVEPSPTSGIVVDESNYEFFKPIDPRSWLACEGFLTSEETSDFCTETVPEKWQGFEYDSKVFYLVPLAQSN